MNGDVSKETEKWGKQLLHPNKSKAGFLPRTPGETRDEIKKIDRAEPSLGVSDRGKSNAHGHQSDAHGNTGIDPINKDRRGKK